MNKVTLIRLFSISVFVALLLVSLLSITTMPNEMNNGFSRIWLNTNEVPQLNNVKLTEKLSSIAGIDSRRIYLSGEGQYAILVLDKNLNRLDTLVVNTDVSPTKLVPYSMYIDDSGLYIHVNNEAKVIFGKFTDDSLTTRKVHTGILSKSIQISDSIVIVRAFDSLSAKLVFKKIDLRTGNVVREADPVIHDDDNTMGLSSDGNFLFEPKSGSIFFVEYFRNKFYRLDENLDLVYRGNTIDTLSTNGIVLKAEAVVDSFQKLVPNKARIKVNIQSFVDNNYLYVISGIRGDEQSISEFNSSMVLDLYRLIDGGYVGSVKMPKVDLKSSKSIRKVNDTVYALFENEFATFLLKTPVPTQ